jgi:hypothetical protein
MKSMTAIEHSSSAPVLLALLASCGGQTLDVGSTAEAGSSSTTDQGAMGVDLTGRTQGVTPQAPPRWEWPDPTACAEGEGLEWAGTWTGYAQGQGDADDFTLHLAGSETDICGTIMFGKPLRYVAATDPEVLYPGPNSLDVKRPERLPGFSYTLLSVERDRSRLQFSIGFAEPYASWCGLQESFFDEYQDGYACLPAANGMKTKNGKCYSYTHDGKEWEVPCGQYAACLLGVSPCWCHAQGCVADPHASGISFDLRFGGTTASGDMEHKFVILEKL